MVDPNRHLDSDQLAFLRECEEEFKHRYTDRDPQYRLLLAKETESPPIIHPWKEQFQNRNYHHRGGRGGGGRGGGGGGGGYQRNHWDNRKRDRN